MNSITNTYRFLDFYFEPEKHQLHHQSQLLSLSKKNHLLLLALVESEGKVLNKDQLIERIWPDQIITDAALNKQITRLRQTLAEYETETIIETVRGVGIRFMPAVHRQVDSNKSIEHIRKDIWVIGSILLALALSIWWLTQSQGPTNSVNSSNNTINMAIIPELNSSDWFNLGAVDHLTSRLREYPEIQTVTPENQWFKRSDKDVLSIELSQVSGIEYVLMLGNHQTAEGFSADLTLRNSQQVIAKEHLTAESINLLLQRIETWTQQQLTLDAEISDWQTTVSEPTPTTDYLMETHIRGLAAARAKEYTQAQRLFNTVTTEDPGFFPAWFALAQVELELGHFDKALGLIDAVSKSAEFPTNLRTKAQAVKANILVYLNRLADAQKLINASNKSAEENNDINIIIQNLNTQALLNNYNGDVSTENVRIQQRLLQLIEQHTPTPNRLAHVRHNLAVAQMNIGEMEAANTNIHSAMQHFKQTDNAEGVVSAHRVLGELLSQQAKNAEAVQTMNAALPWIERVEGARTQALYWMAKARNHYEVGDLKSARKCIAKLHSMAITLSTLQPKVKALIIEAELAISYQQFNQARQKVDELLGIIMDNPAAYPIDAPYTAALDMYVAVRNGNTQAAKSKKQQYLQAYPELAESIPNELKRINAHILANQGHSNQAFEALEALEATYLENQDILSANYIAYELLGLLNPSEVNRTQPIINRVKNRPHFAYPINKHLALEKYHNNQLIPAITLLSELKVQAKDFWTAEDQLMLERWQQENSQG